MAELVLDYSEILDAAKLSDKVSKKCEEYANGIERKITKKFDRLELGASDYTGAATEYACKKMSQLNDKADKYTRYRNGLENFVNDENGAKEVDANVARTLDKSYRGYIKEHNIRVNPIVEGFVALTVWVGNATGFGRVLKQLYDFGKEVRRGLKESLEYWYRCMGGKNVIKITLAAIGVVAAVVAAIVAWPVMMAAFTAGTVWSIIVASAAFVGAVIAAVDSVVNFIAEIHSGYKMWTNNPAEAMMSSNINSTSEFFTKTDFKSKKINRFSMKFATAIEKVELVCNIIAVGDMVKNGISFVIQKGSFSNLKTDFINSFKKDGKWDKKNTWKNFKNYVNASTENIALKYWDTEFKMSGINNTPVNLPGIANKFIMKPETYHAFRQIHDSKGLKITKKILETIDNYGDSGWKGVGKYIWKDTYKQIKIVDKTVRVVKEIVN